MRDKEEDIKALNHEVNRAFEELSHKDDKIQSLTHKFEATSMQLKIKTRSFEELHEKYLALETDKGNNTATLKDQ